MQVPLVLIVGFLGAGKTTLLQRMIPVLARAGIRPRVILNDYQDATVDAARLAALDALVSPISGDCVCCGSREELLSALTGMTPEPRSVVLIEANGTSDATELHDMLALDHRLAAFTPPVQLSVIDVKRWQKRWWHNALEREQTATASHLWLNWDDAVAPERAETVRTSLTAVNPSAARVTVDDFSIALVQLAEQGAGAAPRDKPSPARPDDAGPSQSHDTAHHHFASLGIEFPPVISRADLTKLVTSFAPDLQRAKGVACFAEEPNNQYVWNFLGGDKDLQFDKLPATGFRTVAVFIGAGLPHEEIRRRVSALNGAPAPFPSS